MKIHYDAEPRSSLSPVLARLFQYFMRRDAQSWLLHVAYVFFAVFTLWMAFHHVPWRDEAQAWLLARDLSVKDLFFVARHDGHPILWFLSLKALQATGANYLGMMILNWIFIVIGIWLLFYRSGLPLIARLSVAYVPACWLDIAFIARDYTITIFLCFLAATLYPKVEEKPLRFSAILALLASTNVYGFAVFVGISSQFILEQAFDFGRGSFSLRPLLTKYLVANVILLVGAVFLVAQLAPVQFPGDTFPPLPQSRPYVVGNLLSPFPILLYGVAAALVLMSKLPSYPRVLGGIPMMIVATIPMLAWPPSPRHFFMLAAGIVYYCWIYLNAFGRAEAEARKPGIPRANVAVVILVLVACLGTRPSGILKLYYPPYDSRRAGEAVVANGLDRADTVMVTTDPFRATGLFLFLKNIRAAYGAPPFESTPISYTNLIYFTLRDHVPSLAEMKPTVLNVARENPGKTVVVVSIGTTNPPEPAPNDPDYHLVPIYETPPGPNRNKDSETFHVYVLKSLSGA